MTKTPRGLQTLKKYISHFNEGIDKQDFSYTASGNINGIPLQKTILHSVQSWTYRHELYPSSSIPMCVAIGTVCLCILEDM